MAEYKVSYKVLGQQGEDMKAVAKMVDSYAERVAQINGKLGSDALLEQVRGNLQKLYTQLGESRSVLNTAGELLLKSVEGYTGAETRQVKKVDSMKAHNRDFYKNPVVVASAGGGAGGAAGGMIGGAVDSAVGGAAAGAVSGAVDSAVGGAADGAVSGAAAGEAAGAPGMASTGIPVNHRDTSPRNPYTLAQENAGVTHGGPAGIPSDAAAPAPKADGSAGLFGAGAAVGAGVLGSAAAAGAVLGGIHLKKQHDEKSTAASEAPFSDNGYDPEMELLKARQRLKELEREDEESL